ncbi:MAG: HIT domain-containing protein [Candidatus Saccharibacteria bacterium]
MSDSVFTKIIKGELPSYKVYEDDKTIVIVPLYPVGKGNVMAIPKLQVDHLVDLPDEDYQALMATVKKVAKHIQEVLQPKRVGLMVEGLDVPHVHVQVIAFDTMEQFREIPDESQPPDDQKRAELAKKLTFLGVQ